MKIKTNKGYITQANNFAFHYYADNSIKDGIRNSPTHIDLGLRDYISCKITDAGDRKYFMSANRYYYRGLQGVASSLIRDMLSYFSKNRNMHILSDLNESLKQYIKFYNKDYKSQ